MERIPAANDNLNKVPTRAQVENALEKLRAERQAYVHRLTATNEHVGSEFEPLEADSADAQLADFDERIRTLELGLTKLSDAE